MALFASLSTVWGGSYVAIEVGLTAFPPVFLTALQYYLAAAVLLTAVVLSDEDPWPRTRADGFGILAGGGLFIYAGGTLHFLGQQYTTGGVAAIVYSLIPLLSGVFGVLLTDSSLTRTDLAGILVGLVGVGLVARPSPTGLDATLVGLEATTLGVGLVFAGAVAVALGSVLVERVETACSAVVLTAWATLAGALFTHATSVVLGELATATATTAVWPLVSLAYLGVVSSAGGYLLFFTLLARVGSFQSNLVSYVSPAVAAVAGFALLGERLSLLAVVGFGGILLGFLLVKSRTVRAELARVADVDVERNPGR